MARYAPSLTPERLGRMTPAETKFIADEVNKMREDEAKFQIALVSAATKALAHR